MTERVVAIGASWTRAARDRAGFRGRFFAYRPASLAAILLCMILALTVLGPLVAPYGRDAIDLDRVLDGPSPAHVLGTDELGRDILTRLVYGGRYTLIVAFASVVIATVIGVLVGSCAGYFGGAVDLTASSSVDLFLSVPVFMIILIAASLGGGRIWMIPLIIGGMSWMETARVVRSSFLSLRREEFVEAARSLGVRNVSIVFRHIMPQVIPPVIIAATVGFAQAMLVESALSFLGFGVQPPVPTWGNMLYNAQLLMRRSTIAAFAPGFLIFMTCLCFNVVGRGLGRALARGPDIT